MRTEGLQNDKKRYIDQNRKEPGYDQGPGCPTHRHFRVVRQEQADERERYRRAGRIQAGGENV